MYVYTYVYIHIFFPIFFCIYSWASGEPSSCSDEYRDVAAGGGVRVQEAHAETEYAGGGGWGGAILFDDAQVALFFSGSVKAL
jgi:hypothetical protein